MDVFQFMQSAAESIIYQRQELDNLQELYNYTTTISLLTAATQQTSEPGTSGNSKLSKTPGCWRRSALASKHPQEPSWAPQQFAFPARSTRG